MRERVRRLLAFGVALTVVALALGVTVRLLEPPPGVTPANVERVRPGMPLESVASLLGGLAERELPLDGCAFSHVSRRLRWEAQTARLWLGEQGTAYVGFDDAGKVTGAFFQFADRSAPRPSSPLELLRATLGW
jgi:hypothetical protein